MWRRAAPLLFTAALVSCGEDKKPADPGLPDVVEVFVGPDTANVSIAVRVQAVIDSENADQCRFVMATTNLVVTEGGVPVEGALVYFLAGLRVDFTPNGLFEYGTTYEYEVTTECAATVTGSFTTAPAPASGPTVAIGDVVRIENMAISEPEAIAPLLRGFLEDADLIMKVMDFDATSMRVLGTEGKDLPYDPSWPDQDLKVFMEGGFLFPMEGVFKWPYFQSVGSLGIPVEVIGDDESTIDLEHFEVSGQFFGTSPDTEVVAGVIRASSPCDQVCAVQEQELQLVCANRNSICDAAGMLNLVGSFEAPANNLSFTHGSEDPFQEFLTRVPAPATTGVNVATEISVTLSRGINPDKDDAVSFFVTDPSGAEIAGTTVLGKDDASATFTPDAPLAANTTYTVLVVALDATEWQFTTAL